MSNSNEPRRHHYIPKFLLEHFTDDDGRLYIFDKQRPEQGVFESSPQNVFLQRDFNTTLDLNRERDYSVENEFSKIEGLASQIITKVIQDSREGKFPNLTPDDKSKLDRFVHIMCSRSPEFRIDFKTNWKKPFREGYDRIAKEEGGSLRWDDLPKEEQERYLDNALKEFPLTTHGPISEKLSFLLQTLSNKKICIAMVPTARKSFIIGSDPVILIRNATADDIEEVWLPVSHDISVVYYSESRFDYMPEEEVRFFNEKIIEKSQIVAGRSKRLIESLSQPYWKSKGLRLR